MLNTTGHWHGNMAVVCTGILHWHCQWQLEGVSYGSVIHHVLLMAKLRYIEYKNYTDSNMVQLENTKKLHGYRKSNYLNKMSR